MKSEYAKSGPRSMALLSAFDERQTLVIEKALTLFEYYEELDPLIDDEAYRRLLKIRHVSGQLFDSEGRVFQQFDLDFDQNGERTRGRIVHDDGTVCED